MIVDHGSKGRGGICLLLAALLEMRAIDRRGFAEFASEGGHEMRAAFESALVDDVLDGF